MRNYLLILAAGAALAASTVHATPSTDPARMPAGSYVLDKNHASVTGRVLHQGFSFYTFRFNAIDAEYRYDPAKPAAATLVVKIDTRSFDSGLEAANKEFPTLFLAADRFPEARFVSKSIRIGANSRGQVTGDLTLAGVTKPVTLDVSFLGSAEGKSIRAGFSATTTIKRSDFGSTAMLGGIGDDVALSIEVEFLKQP